MRISDLSSDVCSSDLVVDLEVEGIRSGSVTYGHRFHHPGQITIGNAGDYVEKLRLCHVIVDQNERQQLIESKAKEAAAAAGLFLREDQGLVAENAGLTEWRSEEQPSELQSLMRISYAVFCLKQKKNNAIPIYTYT